MTDSSYTVVPASRMRRVIATRMRQTISEQPQVTLHTTADAAALLAARASWKKHHPTATVTVLVLHAVSRALQQHPRLNGRVDGDEVHLHHAVNLGCAIALEDGLVVPILRDAHTKTVTELADELSDLRERARAGTLRAPNLAEGTFTVSALGAYGVEFFTPIINPPQLAILGVGAIRDHVRYDDATLRRVSYLHLSLTFDHAAVDGAQAARLLQAITGHIEQSLPLPNPPAPDNPVGNR